jgi:hypothetical protein
MYRYVNIRVWVSCIGTSIGIFTYMYMYIYILCKHMLNPFQCGSLESAHRAASGPIRPDNIGLFGPLPPGENTYPYSCGPIGEDHSLYGDVNC